MRAKRGRTKPKSIILHAILLLSIAILFFISYSDLSYANCAFCDGVYVGGYDLCCSTDDDGVCPEEYGDWVAAGCSVGPRGICQTEDKDCCPIADWSDTGWPGIVRDPYGLGPTTNYCCGNEVNLPGLQETKKTCAQNIGQYGLSCIGPCIDKGTCAQNSVEGCCDNANDCYDPFTSTCYNNNDIAKVNGMYTQCISGTWSKGPNIQCTNGTTECLDGLCIDANYNGIVNDSDLGVCGSCTNLLSSGPPMCGTIAFGTTTVNTMPALSRYYICSGSGALPNAYLCYDQNTSAADNRRTVPCYDQTNVMLESDPQAGGLMTNYMDQGMNYTRCGPNRVCTATPPFSMTWPSNGNSPIAIGGGSCAQIDTAVPTVSLRDMSDATPNIVSIAHRLQINVSTNYLVPADGLLPPDWKFLFGCVLNFVGMGARNTCGQYGNISTLIRYLWATEGKVKSSAISSQSFAHANYSFEPRCNSSFIRNLITVSSSQVYTGWGGRNNWYPATVSNAASFQVVSCESNADAQAVANFDTSYALTGSGDATKCAAGGVCANSYCDASLTKPCASDLDNTSTCYNEDAPACCSRGGFAWTNEGEAVAFGGYGDVRGNIDYPITDTVVGGATINSITECCGDDAGENYVTTKSADSTIPGACCMTNANLCISNGFCNKNVATGGRETCPYNQPLCSGVGQTSSCTDGHDNDCDGFTDYCDGIYMQCPIHQALDSPNPFTDRRDPDCTGVIKGRVLVSGGPPPVPVLVKAKMRIAFTNIRDISAGGAPVPKVINIVEFSNTTNLDGEYSIVVNGNMGYDLTASAAGYRPTSLGPISPGFMEIKIQDINMITGPTDCNADCTTGGTPLCTRACEGWGGCNFFDEIVAEACEGKRPGFRVSYDSTHDIICCNSGGLLQKEAISKLDNKAVTERKNIVRVTRPIILDGEQINMVIDLFT